MKPPVIEDQHRWLQKLLGQWSVEEQDPESAGTYTGTETFRPLGDIWVLGEGNGRMPGAGDVSTLMTLGYSAERQKFVGTWIGSMMTHLWVYEGTLDPGGSILTLECEGPSFTGENRMDRYRDAIEFRSDDYRTLTASVLGADGTWNTFMTTHYRRSA